MDRVRMVETAHPYEPLDAYVIGISPRLSSAGWR
jgi:hypothetical protein